MKLSDAVSLPKVQVFSFGCWYPGYVSRVNRTTIEVVYRTSGGERVKKFPPGHVVYAGSFKEGVRGEPDPKAVDIDWFLEMRYKGEADAAAAAEAAKVPRDPRIKDDEEATFTTAPQDYDWTGFGTRHIEDVRTTAGGKTVRLVATKKGFHTVQQRNRYASGLHMAMSAADWEKIKDLTIY